jgi:hypothetical protein
VRDNIKESGGKVNEKSDENVALRLLKRVEDECNTCK